MFFSWDEEKNKVNRLKHGISFQTASLVFNDPCVLCEADHRYAYSEERWKSTGLAESHLICVAHTVEDYHYEENIRIISAREASSNETRRYRINRGNEGGAAGIEVS